jgi:hypothetical protein
MAEAVRRWGSARRRLQVATPWLEPIVRLDGGGRIYFSP